MRYLSACIPSLLWATLIAAHVIKMSDIAGPNVLRPLGLRYILELDPKSVGLLNGRGQEIRRIHDHVYMSLQEQAIPYQVLMEYDDPEIFSGVSVMLKSVADLKRIENIQGIVAARLVTLHRPAMPVGAQILNDSSIAITPADTEPTHVMTGVDKLHAEGLTGEGIMIGIIDTGVDYTHPALGGKFGPGNKVVGGYDFVGDAYDGTNTPKQGPDPLDQCNGHGTHVAGIIGADVGGPYGSSGVAYKSLINAYRVFGCSGSVSDDVLVQALLRANSDNNHIITLSLGGAGGWSESTSAVVASRIAKQGRTVTIAAGNDGFTGAWYTSDPGTGIKAISVGSVENDHVLAQTANVNVVGQPQRSIFYISLQPLPVAGSLPIYATSKDITVADDACNPLPDSTPNLGNKVVIIRRGTCTFVQKLKNVQAKGANVALIYDNGRGFNAISSGDFKASLIQAKDGEFLVQQFGNGVPVTISFPQAGGAVVYANPAGGLMSGFSSYGPSFEMYSKPAVSAPGGNIVSTWPVKLGAYAILSGTSMATPFVAGSTALVYQAKGTTFGFSPRTLFESTAQSIPLSNTKSDPLQTVAKQGAGLIQVHKAVHYKTVVSPGLLTLNDTSHLQATHEITVTNTGSTAQSYVVSHLPAGTANTVGRFSNWPHLGPLPLVSHFADVDITPSTFNLGSKGSIKVKVKITPPTGVNPANLPVYSGFLNIKNNDEVLQVSYVGVKASLIDKKILDDSSHFFGVDRGLPFIQKPDTNIQTGPTTYTFVNNDFPTVFFRLLFGTRLFRLDLVNLDQTVVGTLAHADYLPRNDEDPQGNGSWSILLDVPTFEDGSPFPNGSFRMLMKVLRVNGNPKNDWDYEKWLSPVLTIKVK